MNILAAIKREEKKLEKQMSKLQHQLNGIRSAAEALGHSAAVEVKGAKKRALSAAGRAAIAKAAKKRWAKVRAAKKKAA
jgi:t-SNARE complex subunit (syntaxin)